jgi:hypothetical protein
MEEVRINITDKVSPGQELLHKSEEKIRFLIIRDTNVTNPNQIEAHWPLISFIEVKLSNPTNQFNINKWIYSLTLYPFHQIPSCQTKGKPQIEPRSDKITTT